MTGMGCSSARASHPRLRRLTLCTRLGRKTRHLRRYALKMGRLVFVVFGGGVDALEDCCVCVAGGFFCGCGAVFG